MLPDFANNPLEVFAIWNGGFVFYGGVIAAVPVGLWQLKWHGLPVWKTADIVAPHIALAHGFGRLGCFFAGCCFDAPHAGLFSITFQEPHSLAPLGVAPYPAQLMESGGAFLIFSIRVLLRRYERFDGQLFWLYVLFYSVMRIAIEFFRGDAIRGVHLGGVVSTLQITAVLLFGASLVALWRLGQKKKIEAQAEVE
jgi:phosphatidylglycerol---prolipoprotein diacylglyceryl transferase